MNALAQIIDPKPRVGTCPYTHEEREAILEHVLTEVSTGRSVNRILKDDPFMPAPSQFWRWHFESPVWQEKLGRARENGVETHIDEVIDIVDSATDDVYIEFDKDGDPVAKLDGSAIARARLRAEYRLKRAQMIAPRKYGAKVDVTSGGEALKPAEASQTKIDALIQLGVSKALQLRELKNITPKENDDA